MKKDRKRYNILVIEDNPGDYFIVEELLSEHIEAPNIVNAPNFKTAVETLSVPGSFDVILLDLSLPDKQGQDLLTEVLKLAGSQPVIVLTGNTDIDFSTNSISQGVLDYLLKDELNAIALYKSIVYAIERKRAISKIKESEKRYSDLFQLSPQPMFLYDEKSLTLVDFNKAAVDHFGYSTREFSQMSLLDLVIEEEVEKILKAVKGANQTFPGKFITTRKSGELMEMEIFSTPIQLNDEQLRLIILIDVTKKNLYKHKITKAIIKTQEDERYEIGSELHDNVCQILATSQLTLGMLKESLAPEGLKWYAKCGEYISLATHEVRNLSHRLAPAFFNESTLEQAFNTLLSDFNLEGKYEISLFFDKALQKYTLSLEMQLNLYRILQEQLKNIVKYASASYIEVDVVLFNNKLLMKISDDGVGFDTSIVKSGIGLANMKRRAELFSGRFNINSSPGQGCVVMVNMPLQQTG